MFCERYRAQAGIDLVEYRTFPDANGCTINATIMDGGNERVIEGHGSGPLDAFVDALRCAGIGDIAVLTYHEHALGARSDARAVAYVEAGLPDGRTISGVHIDRDIVSASLRAVTSIAKHARDAGG
jgi:2-isopropylmalate synthase